MAWNHQRARWAYYDLLVWKERELWRYSLKWHTDTAMTTVGVGSARYEDVFRAREAAILHLASILPKPQSKRLLADQADLAWEPWYEVRKPFSQQLREK
jgi:hypothetical protein